MGWWDESWPGSGSDGEWDWPAGSSSDGGGGGSGWSGAPMPSRPPPPPGHAHLYDAYSKGYHTGFCEGSTSGYHKGYSKGWASGRDDMHREWKGHGKGRGKRDSEEEEADENEKPQQKSKRKKKGAAWKEFYEKYTDFDAEKNKLGCAFYTKLGPKEVSVYPTEIQHKLLTAWREAGGYNTSQDVEYDMTQGWMYTLRIFGGDERVLWDEKLSELPSGMEDKLVGAQWDATKVKKDPPLDFDPKVKYRPIYMKDSDLVEDDKPTSPHQ